MDHPTRDTPNGIRSRIHLQRLSFDLDMRVSSDTIESYEDSLLIDQPQKQIEYIFSSGDLEPPLNTIPWIHTLMVHDFIKRLPNERKEEYLDNYWKNPTTSHIPLLKLILANTGAYHSKNRSMWLQRLKECILQVMVQQPHNHQLEEHWLKPLY